ncbi:MAG: NlpC/P60 family protein [Rhodoglobus sp.]|nr:NlpC/P60 family protein [Rhodoglobus sp.]
MANVGPETRTTAPLQLENTEVEKFSSHPSPADEVPEAFSSTRAKRRSSVLSLAVTAVIVPGLFATVALPAYAFAPPPDTSSVEAAEALQEFKETDAQSVLVSANAPAGSVTRDAFSTTSAAEMRAAALATAAASAGTTTVASYLANPPYPNFSLDAVVSVGLQYQGVPYVFGGADPSGFDCSGFVMYVYAQFGVGLPHGVGGQSSLGTVIDESAALPGDVVILSDGSHDGIYMGGGMILDAPQPGGVVSVRPLWTSSYYIVRFGI